ncbi:MAG: phosphatidate cytidylyltransferase [Dehalococcoidia bacterium]
MLPQRVASAVVGVPVIIGIILLGGIGYSVALAFVLAVAALEFFAFLISPDSEPTTSPRPLASPLSALERLLGQRPLGYIGAAFVALLVAAAHNGADWWTGALALAVAVTFLWLIWQGDTASGLRDWLTVVTGIVYIGFLGSHLVFLRALEGGRDWTLIAVFATFAADSAAYFVGHAFGRTKLAPRISPGKTVEGSIGGLLSGALAVLLLNWALDAGMDMGEAVPLALLLPIAATVGDLGESLMKRGAGVKDASAIVPGHGGFLDRLDSLLLSTVLVYYYLIWVVLP